MLPTFVIGLREGAEAALIVGIIGAFLRQEGRQDALRWMWAGVTVAIGLCVAAAVALQILDDELPQKQQEGLETVVAAIAVGMVTFMILWMRRHARGLAGELRANAAGALARGSTWALVAMAFFAIVREGLETAVFLLAAFQASGNATAAGIGALLGVLVAALLGLAIYRGGVRLNLAAVLPPDRRRAGARGCRARHVGAAHRSRGGLVEQPAGQGGRSELPRPSRHRHELAPDRGARAPAAADGRRDAGLAGLRGSDAGDRALARSSAPDESDGPAVRASRARFPAAIRFGLLRGDLATLLRRGWRARQAVGPEPCRPRLGRVAPPAPPGADPGRPLRP